MAALGPRVAIVLAVPQAQANAITAAGGVVAPPVSGLALIDTGCSITSIDDQVATNLGLQAIATTTVHAAGGTRQAVQYMVQADVAGTATGLWTMTTAILAPTGIIALVGTDLLAHCLFVYDGIGGRFTLAL
jgi:predicted aspartyl protease